MPTRPSRESEKREKTLLASLLLSMFAPLATGIAVLMSSSATQIADFIRRSVEFLALLLSWLVFRHLARQKHESPEKRGRLERLVQKAVALSLALSGLIMLSLTLLSLQSEKPGGNVLFGLAVALLGLIVNVFFWRRYTFLSRGEASLIMDAQRQLYLAKIVVDLCVVTALGAVALLPAAAITRRIDSLGSAAVALYLLWSSQRTWSRVGGASEGSESE